MLHSVNYFIHS